MKTKTRIRAGGLSSVNHNAVKTLKIKTRVRAGALTANHNPVRA
ncbi:MAG: hypothetical protein JWM10_1891 [Myxococcaceae bacterium]|nr:hypothetical protein [Myxococcaceae bacterium]